MVGALVVVACDDGSVSVLSGHGSVSAAGKVSGRPACVAKLGDGQSAVIVMDNGELTMVRVGRK
jgi:hypothetical protein